MANTEIQFDVRPVEPATGTDFAVRRTKWWQGTSGRVGLKVVPAILFLGFWDLGARVLDSQLVPQPVPTLVAVIGALGSPQVLAGFATSNLTLILGFTATVCLGIPLGLLMGRARMFAKIADVWLDVLLVVPMAGLIPLVIMALGLGTSAQVFVVAIFAFPYVVINCRAGTREVPVELIEMARVYEASEVQLWRRILLPAAAPAIWAGIRIGLGRAITGMVLVELLLAASGIGQLLQRYRAEYRSEQVYAVVLLVVFESILLIGLVRYFESRTSHVPERV